MEHHPAERQWLGRLRFVFVAALVVNLIGAFTSPAAMWSGYLVGAYYWLGVSLGCMGIALIHRTTSGRWGRAIARPLHSGIGAVWVGLLAFVILAIGAGWIYPWARGDANAPHLNPHQVQYFSLMWLLPRLAVYAAGWIIYGMWLRRRYRYEATHPESTSPRKAGFGILVFFITTSFFLFDAVLSLTPDWTSSLFPLQQLLSFGVTAMAMCIITRNLDLSVETTEDVDRTHDLGNLLQAFNLLWVYLSFSQYLIIWAGDLPHEVSWYLQRRGPVGGWTAIALFVFHFVVPFTLLLSRDVKRRNDRVSRVAALLLVMCLVDNCWTILPSCPDPGATSILFAVANWLMWGAVWGLGFIMARRRLPAIEVHLAPQGENGHSTSVATAGGLS